MIAIIVKNTVKKENQKKFMDISEKHIVATLDEDEGCVFFEMSKPNGEEIVFFELWESKEDIDRHNKNTLAREHIGEINKLRESRVLEVHDLV